MITDKAALTVSQLNTYVKMLFESDDVLRRVCVVGEISNFVNHFKTGHLYFSVKDEFSAVKAVMFAGNAKNLKIRPENGMRVIITGRVSVFERDGVYQIYADSMEPEGAGSLMIAFEQLKKKLSAEGVFDIENKRPLPEFPQKIAVLTSPVGAALQDVINVIARRYPLCEIVFCPVAVQGINCAKENISALQRVNMRDDIDVIILGRGGGSVEDLWGYNDEQLVRAIFNSRIPVITGIGHETDFTLCDFVSDMRAPTPSAAAEIAVPDILELVQYTDSLSFRLDKAMNDIIDEQTDYIFNLTQRLKAYDPVRILENRFIYTDSLKLRIRTAIDYYISQKDSSLNILCEKLQLLNPYSMIEKGYIPVFRDNKRVMSASALSVDDTLSMDFIDGKVKCLVKNIELTE